MILVIAGVGVILAISAVLLAPFNPGPATSSSSTQTSSTRSSPTNYLSLLNTVPLPATQGRIDHMSVDLKRGLLFVAGYVNNTVGIVDLSSGRLLRSIGGLNNPQGVAWVPDAGRLFVSNAGDGKLEVFDGTSFALERGIPLTGDADNLRYDAATKLLYVGYGSGGIAKIDTTSGSVAATITLPAHPESFQVEANGRGIYVNVPPSNLIMAFDKVTGKSISNRSMTGSNFPMALDESGGRLFVATRSPPELRVLDTSSPSLRSVANVTIPGDPDDVFLDPARGLVYVSCGQGYLEVIKQTDASHFQVVQSIATGAGARTSLFVPELGWVFVAVPASAGQQAEILVYGTSPLNSTSVSVTSSAPPQQVPTAASLLVLPNRGPTGLLVTLSGGGYFPGAEYTVCIGGYGNSSCGFEFTSADYITTIDEFATMGSFTADPSGNIPAGTRMQVPDLFGRNYTIGVGLDGRYSFFVSVPFTVTAPTLSIGAVSVAPYANLTLTGGGYAPNAAYTVCMVPVGTVDCGYTGDREETPPGFHVGNFTADQNGNIPPGTIVTVPFTPAGQYAIGIFMPSGGYILISEVSFTLRAAG